MSVPFCEARARGHGRLSHVLCFRRFICLGGSTVPSPSDGTHGYRCPPGFRCPPGAHSELPCAPGTFSPVSGADACLPCPAGTYCPKAATVEPTTCPKGDERPQGSGQMGSSSPGAAPGTMCHRRGRGPAPETGLVAPQREVRGGCRGSHWGQCQRPPFTPFVAIRLSLPVHLSSQWVPRRRGCTCHGGETQVWDLGRLGQSQPPLEGAAVPRQSLCVRKARPVTRTSPTPGGRLPVL